MSTAEHESSLDAIKKLLILSLVGQGITQTHVAAALGIHQTSLSRMFPKGLLADIARRKSGSEESNGN